MSKRVKVSLLPRVSVVELAPLEYGLGRVLEVAVSPPNNEAEADLLGDTFFCMYKAAPKLKPENKVGIERALNRLLLGWLLETEAWQTVHQKTLANLLTSLSTAILMWDLLRDDLILKEIFKEQQEIEETLIEAQKAEQQAQAYQEAGMHESAQKSAQHAAMLKASAQAKVEAAKQNLENIKRSYLGKVAVAGALEQAKREAEKVTEVVCAWGDGIGRNVLSDPSAALELMGNFDEKIGRILRLVGRLRGIGWKARHHKVDDVDGQGYVPTDVTLTKDLRGVWPQELAFLNPRVPRTLRAHAALRFAEEGFMGWEYEPNNKERGLFVVAVDASWSMGTNDKEIYAKAIALALAKVARAEGHDYVIFTFNGWGSEGAVVTSKQDLRDHIAWARHGCSGGTSFDWALKKLMESISGLDPSLTDAVVISDGQCEISPDMAEEWKRFAVKHGVRLFYVAVGQGYGDMEGLADAAVSLEDLNNKTADELTAEIARWLS